MNGPVSCQVAEIMNMANARLVATNGEGMWYGSSPTSWQGLFYFYPASSSTYNAANLQIGQYYRITTVAPVILPNGRVLTNVRFIEWLEAGFPPAEPGNQHWAVFQLGGPA